MGIKRIIAEKWASLRVRRLRQWNLRGPEIQGQVLKSLLKKAENTAFGQTHGFKSLQTEKDFKSEVPVRSYEAAKTFFERIVKGESDIMWPGKPVYLAKTSGTTSGAKFIPITGPSIRSQIAAARDALFCYIHETGNSAFLDGKMMFLSGSPVIETNDHGMKIGRLSGIVNHFVPAYLTKNRVPTFETNSIEKWETKVERILDEIEKEDLRLISGIPPWVQMLFERLEERTGKKPLEIWPNLELFVQGGVDFKPYRKVFDQYLDGKVRLAEVFPASEGFFAFQDKHPDEGLLLNVKAGMYFEFIPFEDYHKENPRRLKLDEVKIGENYALIVSSNAGLWAYDIGDTIRFVSLKPYRIRVTGRVKHFISAFGEHVIGEEVNKSMIEAEKATKALVNEFTVAPLFREKQGASAYEWLVDFETLPEDWPDFIKTLDDSLRKQNSYYNDLRKGNMLAWPEVSILEKHATRRYMDSVGKLGGQNKFPRLGNDRKVADGLAPYIKEKKRS